MKEFIVKNWAQGFKSLAVWFPVIATGLLAVVEYVNQSFDVPFVWIPVIVGVTSFLGWVIRQPSIKQTKTFLGDK